jgi:two-component system, NarL family, sensor histidine kinase EvgS
LRAMLVEDDRNDRVVQLCVEDSGMGIPPDKRHDLFQKFQTHVHVLDQGAGIGLWLCKKITLLLAGDMA